MTTQQQFSILSISHLAKSRSNTIMETKDIRRANLLILLRDWSATGIANAAGTDPSYISQIKTTKRDMGGALARSLEKVAGKNRGWMDVLHENAHDEKRVVTQLDDRRIHIAFSAIEKHLSDVWARLSPSQQEVVFKFVYGLIRDDGSIDVKRVLSTLNTRHGSQLARPQRRKRG
jgi:hypothetical protein